MLTTFVLVLVLAPVAQAKQSHRYWHGAHARAHKECSNRLPRSCVRNAIIHNRHWLAPWQKAWLRRIPGCESTWRAWVQSGPNMGLYQFNIGTWRGLPARYSRYSPLDPGKASLAAAYMVRSGRTGEWACG